MTSSRHTIAALDKLETVLLSSIKDIERVLVRVSAVRAGLQAGEPLGELVEASERPLIIERLAILLDRLGDASSALRRAEAQQLFAEGFTRTRIATTFGVSRQRATTLLSRGRGPAAGSHGRREGS